MRQNNEPSVEEILDSIKKVIARDNRTHAGEERQKRATRGLRPDSEQPPAYPEDPAAYPENNASEDVLDLEPAPLCAEDCDGEDSPESPLIGDTVRASMQENLAALSMLAQPSTPPQIVRSGETSLEGLVREMLRPMLAEWLDNNLPDMVEKMVQDEIDRIAGKHS